MILSGIRFTDTIHVQVKAEAWRARQGQGTADPIAEVIEQEAQLVRVRLSADSSSSGMKMYFNVRARLPQRSTSAMIDGYRPHAVYNYVRDWCETYHLPNNKTIAATGKKKYTAVEAETLAVPWCNRMAYLYEIWRLFADDSFAFEYSVTDVEQYQEPALVALMDNAATSPSARRFVETELRTLVPRVA